MELGAQGMQEVLVLQLHHLHGERCPSDGHLAVTLHGHAARVEVEQALDELSRALGLAGERPDKEWKEGPDNLWALDDVNYIVWECKSEVDLKRIEINKSEAEQMNRSAAWFQKHYPGCKSIHIEVHPANQVQSAGYFLVEVRAMRDKELRSFVRAVQSFFREFHRLNFNDLSLPHIQRLIDEHALDIKSLLNGRFTRKVCERN